RCRQAGLADADGVVDRVRDGAQRRGDVALTDAADTQRGAGGRHLDDDGGGHRGGEGGGDAGVEQGRVSPHAGLVVEVLLRQGHTDALHGAALHLTFHVAAVHRTPGVLDDRVLQDRDLAGVLVNLDVHDVSAVGRGAGGAAQVDVTADEAAG